MDLSGVVFFTFLGAIIIVPQVLRYRERGRLHDTLRMAFERGQPIPPELLVALQSRRRPSDWDVSPEMMAAWRMREAAAAAPVASSVPPGPEPASVTPPAAALLTPLYPSQTRRDLRRGLIWLAVGLGLVAAGVSSYAGLYEVGGAQETLSMFCAFGAVPILVGLTYLALAWFARDKSRG